MTFSDQVDEATSLDMLRVFHGSNYHELDSAHQYNDGKNRDFAGQVITREHRAEI